MHTVLVLGGYGNFGECICRALVKEHNIRLLIAGRNLERARLLAEQLHLSLDSALVLDASADDLCGALQKHGVHTLIHTAGPFQGQNYHVAQACIEASCNYIDLADGRGYVAGISNLNQTALAANVLVTSGASSVPALAAAVADHFLPEFSRLDAIQHAIVSAAKTPGLATIRAVLGYCGKPLIQLKDGVWHIVYGWQNLHSRRYPEPIGRRWLGYCDVPDLELFPQRYPEVKTVTFHAGLGIPLSHISTWALSWLVRWRLLDNLVAWAKPLRWISRRMECIGTRSSAMHVELTGLGLDGRPHQRIWHILAFNHHGVNIPCGAAIALALKLSRGETLVRGAIPCMGLLTLTEYMSALAGLEIRLVES